VDQLPHQKSLKTKFYILRGPSDCGVYLIVEGRNVREAQERVKEIVHGDGSVPLALKLSKAA
jgi:hypothetical protein